MKFISPQLHKAVTSELYVFIAYDIHTIQTS